MMGSRSRVVVLIAIVAMVGFVPGGGLALKLGEEDAGVPSVESAAQEAPVPLSPLLAQGLDQLEGRLPADSRGRLDAALGTADEQKRFVEHLTAAPRLSDQYRMAVDAGGFATGVEAQAPSYDGLGRAIVGLAAASGASGPVDSSELSKLDAVLAEPAAGVVVDLLESLSLAAQLRQQAFAQVSAEDQRYLKEAALAFGASTGEESIDQVLQQHADLLSLLKDDPVAHRSEIDEASLRVVSPATRDIDVERLSAIASRIDTPALVQAGLVALEALEHAVPLLEEIVVESPVEIVVPEPPSTPPPTSVMGAPVPDVCDDILLLPGVFICVGPGPVDDEVCPLPYVPALTISVFGLNVLSLGGAGPNAFDYSVLVGLDLGLSPDCYTNSAGGNLWVANALLTISPLSISLDLGGADSYHGPNPAAPAGPVPLASDQVEPFIEGSGVGGIGILLDVNGPDSYNSYEELRSMGATPECLATPYPGGVGPTHGFAATGVQGSAFFGIGILADLAGSDAYNSYEDLCQYANPVPDFVNFEVTFSQGAAVGGIGLLVDSGDGADAYNSNNRLASLDELLGDNNLFFVQTSQGWATPVPLFPNPILPNVACAAGGICPSLPGVGILLETQGDTEYNSDNVMDTTLIVDPATGTGSAVSLFFVQCTQGSTGCGLPGELGMLGVGLLADATGGDFYNCHNLAEGSTSPLPAGPFVSVASSQGAATTPGISTLAALVDLTGDDCYNSSNDAIGCDAFYTVGGVQAASFGLPGGPDPTVGATVTAGVLVDVEGTDTYNGANAMTSITPGFPALIDVTQAQGAAIGTLSLAVFADLSPNGGDSYNSENYEFDDDGGSILDINWVQGFALGIGLPAVGVMVDVDAASTDLYNSFNSQDGLFGPSTGSTALLNAEGTVLPAGPALAVHIDVGGSNYYNAANVPPFGTPFAPFYDAVHGIGFPTAAAAGELGVFADVSLGADPAVTSPLLSRDCYSGGPAVPLGCPGSPADTVPATLGFATNLATGALAGICLDLLDNAPFLSGDVPSIATGSPSEFRSFVGLPPGFLPIPAGCVDT